jgi:hypothetical protein
MTKLALDRRGKALEEAFFAGHNEKLLRRLRGEGEVSKADALAEASGLDDRKVIEECIALGIHAETFAAMTLAPLVLVAWSDGEVAVEERLVILRTAETAGIARGTPPHDLLENWLKSKPPPALKDTWRNFTAGVLRKLTPEGRKALEHDIVGRARKVADAAGGFLGFGGRISPAEREALDGIQSVFRDV